MEADDPCPRVTFPPVDSAKVGTNTPSANVVVFVSDPDVPVMVTILVPNGAVLLAVSASTVYPFVGLGANDAVSPIGSPETARFTMPVKPNSGTTETKAVVLVPCPTVMELYVDSMNVGAKRFSLKVVVAVILPDVPVTVTVLVPNAVLLLAVSVNMVEYGVGFELNDAVTPLGNPATENVTLPENPNSSNTPMYVQPEVPGPRLTSPELESSNVGT